MMLHNMNNEELIRWTLSSLFTPDDHTKKLAVELANRLEAAHDPEELEGVRDELEWELSYREELMSLVKEIYKLVEDRPEGMTDIQMEIVLDEIQGAIELNYSEDDLNG